MSQLWLLSEIETHRANVTSVDGTSTPASSHSDWQSNTDGRIYCRVFASVSLTGGTSPTVQIRPYMMHKDGSSIGRALDFIELEAGDWVFDVQVAGCDLLCLVEATTGSPTSFDVDMKVAWWT